MRKGNWTFLSNHGRVFSYLTQHPQTTTQNMAQQAGLSLRAVQKIISDLEADGYIIRQKQGRCNRYIIHPELPMRHRLEQNHAVGDLIMALTDKNKINR